MTSDPRITESGDYKESGGRKGVELADKIERTSQRSERFVRPAYPSDGLSADMKFGGGGMTRSVTKPGLKRY